MNIIGGQIVGAAVNEIGKFLGFVDKKGRMHKGRRVNPGYKLFYGIGGHDGPYPTVTAAVKRAKSMLRGSRSGKTVYHVYKVYGTGVIKGERSLVYVCLLVRPRTNRYL